MLSPSTMGATTNQPGQNTNRSMVLTPGPTNNAYTSYSIFFLKRRTDLELEAATQANLNRVAVLTARNLETRYDRKATTLAVTSRPRRTRFTVKTVRRMMKNDTDPMACWKW